MKHPISSVIPAQAGIQSKKYSAQQTKYRFCPATRALFDQLDSCLRGITSDLPACWLSRMASSFINDTIFDLVANQK
jgi:hypothetical protein